MIFFFTTFYSDHSFYYCFIIVNICCLSSLQYIWLEVKVHLKWMQSGVTQFGFWLCQSRHCGNKGNKLGSELLAMPPRAKFVFGMMTRVTRSTDLLSYLQGWLAQGQWSKTGSLPFCKVKMRSVSNKFSFRCLQHLKMLRWRKAFLINEDCNRFVWRKWCNSVCKYSVHCLLFQHWFWIPSSVLSATVTCLTSMRSKGPEKHRIIFSKAWKYQFT